MANPYNPRHSNASISPRAPGSYPRRSSYASVVSGNSPSISQPTRSGAFSHLLNPSPYDNSYESNNYAHNGNSSYEQRNYDTEYTTGESSHRGDGSWGHNGHLPSMSSAYGATNYSGYAYTSFENGQMDGFFVPSYLRGSKYVQRLEEIHRAKSRAQREGQPTQSPLSTSASSVNGQAKIVPSHRGMTYDLIEKAPLVEDDGTPSLPSRWSSSDKYAGLEVLSDGQEVRCTGTKPSTDREHEASSIRADHPMPPQCGIYYFEVTIMSRKREESSIGIGFSGKTVPLSRIPGWEPSSWGYHGDDGHTYSGQANGKQFGSPFTSPDIIGCGINFRTGSAFFTKNGDFIGTAFREIKGSKLYPTVGMKKTGEHIRVNFGHTPFVFDIDGMMAKEEQRIKLDIAATSTAKLAPPLSETDLIQSLVLQFLTHEGYTETARAFAGEVRAEKKALSLDPDLEIRGFEVKEDEDAGHRQRIRTAILDGDVDQALKHTNAYYPHVLRENENVYFRLRCRKFIEMIRQGAEIHQSSSSNGSKQSNGHNGDWYDDVMNQDMEMDDQPSQSNNDDRMDTEEAVVDNQVDYQNLLQDTLTYGQVLQAEFKNDPRREVSKALEEAFALMAYEDPLNSKEVAHLLNPAGRVTVAEELNSAILHSLGKSSTAALEKVYQQTTVLLEDLRQGGGPGAFINIDDYTGGVSNARSSLRPNS